LGAGMVSMTMDTERGHCYGITWPTGHFIHSDVEKRSLHDLGPISDKGEAGMPGADFRTLCRSLLVDPRDGNVYFSTAEGNVFTYNPERAQVELLEAADLKRDYFGRYDPTRPGSM